MNTTLARMQTLVGQAGEALGITEDPLVTVVGARVGAGVRRGRSEVTLHCLVLQILEATREELDTEDWALNMEICDIINHTEEGPTDAVKAIKKR